MNIETDKRKVIYRKDFENRTVYSTRISRKLQDGSYDYAYIPVQFRREVELENKTTIKIKKGWLTFFRTKDGDAVYYVYINEFDIAKENENEYEYEYVKTEASQLDNTNIEITDDDLPF